MATYLDVVNNVLRRLREPTVQSVDDTPYSSMIGVLVNDAKREVEDATEWKCTVFYCDSEHCCRYIQLHFDRRRN